LIQQVQSVVIIAQDGLQKIPALISEISGQVYQFGPFKLDFTRLDLNVLSSQVLGMVQPLLSRTGTLLSTVASGAASFAGWTFFVLLVSFFMLAESGGLRARIINVEIPTYREDVARLVVSWADLNAFLGRSFVLPGGLCLHHCSACWGPLCHRTGVLAGLARFVPYVGPAINWTILVLVTFFQSYKLFGMEPLYYSLLVLGVALLIDQIFDNLVSPRILSDVLKVHPAGAGGLHLRQPAGCAGRGDRGPRPRNCDPVRALYHAQDVRP
jgi:predicted PurR-regulated permease PerM